MILPSCARVFTPSSLFAHPFRVRPVGSRNHDIVAFPDENRDANPESVVDDGVLQDVARCSIPFYRGLRLDDLVLNLHRELNGERNVAVHDDRYLHSFLQILYIISDIILSDGNLLVCLVVHEGIEHPVVKQVLHLLVLNLLDLHVFGRLEIVLKHLPRLYAFDLCSHERRSLSRRNALEVNHNAEIAVIADNRAFAEFVWGWHSWNESCKKQNPKFWYLHFALRIFEQLPRWEQQNVLYQCLAGRDHVQTVYSESVSKRRLTDGW